jgi:hypothetical protein
MRRFSAGDRGTGRCRARSAYSAGPIAALRRRLLAVRCLYERRSSSIRGDRTPVWGTPFGMYRVLGYVGSSETSGEPGKETPSRPLRRGRRFFPDSTFSSRDEGSHQGGRLREARGEPGPTVQASVGLLTRSGPATTRGQLLRLPGVLALRIRTHAPAVVPPTWPSPDSSRRPRVLGWTRSRPDTAGSLAPIYRHDLHRGGSPVDSGAAAVIRLRGRRTQAPSTLFRRVDPT